MAGGVTRAADRKTLFNWVGWFSVLNFFLIAALVGRYLTYVNSLDGVIQPLYVVAALLGHTACLVFLPFLLIFLPVIIVFPRPMVLKTFGVCVATAACTALLIDFGVYSQYRFHLNGIVFDFIVNGGGDIFDFSWATYAFGTLAIIGVIVLELVFSYISARLAENIFKVRLRNKLIVVVLLMLVFSNVVHAWADAAYYRPITTITRHLPLFKPATAKRFMVKHGLVSLDENWKLNKLSEQKTKNNATNYPLSRLEFQPGAESLNIVFVAVDSWRFDMLDGNITPEISRFIKEHPVSKFENHTSGGCGTRTGVFSLFYGVFGSYWLCMETEQIGPVLIDELLNRNYQMGIFASAKLTTPAFNQTVFSAVSDLRLRSDGNNAWQRDLDLVEDWEDWFDKRDVDKPFFNFLFFDSAHAYTFPPDYKRPFTPMLERIDYHKLDKDFNPLPLVNRYKTSLHYIDSLIGRVLNRLDKEGALEKTIVVITSDHGQEFNDNGKNYWGHGSNFTQYQIKVPLVVYWPGKENASYTHLTNHVDLAPTLISDLLKCQNPLSDYSNGRDLFDITERKWMFSGGGLSTQAIIEKNRITELFNTGGYEIFTPDYSVIKNARLNPVAVKESIIEKARFFK